ncbi:tetratricopeptide repeat protein [Lysobacter brunescens]|uniref:Tetratricopeptide repeat protein n=1 Tax=Lysobacter brunescens TaxID=262323 RepID=A0ABW2YD34_9GAMM
MSMPSRERCALLAEECLADDVARLFVLHRLYSKALPADFPAREVSEFLGALHLDALEELFDTLVMRQTSVRSCVSAWDDIPDETFDGVDRNEVRARVSKLGAFYEFASIEGGSNNTLFKLLSDPVLRSHAAITRKIVEFWASKYKEKPKSRFFEFARDSLAQADFPPDEVDGVSGFNAFQQVKKQVSQIKSEIALGNDEKVRRLVSDLASFQKRSRRDLLSKSLCDLASFAKSVGDLERSIELEKMAVQEVPNDAWAHIQLGNSLVAKGEFPAAMEEFRLGEMYGDERSALIGRAEIFKQIGQKANSLEAIERCVNLFPTDIVARNFRASVYAHFGDLQDALLEYNSIIEESLPNAFAFSGRAGVHHDLGNFERGLIDQDLAVSLSVDDPVPIIQKADMLRERGMFSAALSCVDQGKLLDHRWRLGFGAAKSRILRDMRDWVRSRQVLEELKQDFPKDFSLWLASADLERRSGYFKKALGLYLSIEENFIQARAARVGIASTLVAVGELESALNYLNDWQPSTRADWVASHLKGMIYIKRGDLEAAASIFRSGLDGCPWVQQRPYFASGLASVKLRERSYSSALEVLNSVNPNVAPLFSPSFELLRAHALQGPSFTEALQAHAVEDDVVGRLLLDELTRTPISITEEHILDVEWSYLLTLA